MVEEIIYVPEKATVREAAKLMTKHEIGCLVVVNRGKPIGIVTETDMVKRVILKLSNPEKTKVDEIMSQPLVVGNPQMNVDEARKMMNRQRIKKLPIVENGNLVGLVTTTDMIRSPEVLKMMIKSVKRNVVKEIMTSIQEKLELDKW